MESTVDRQWLRQYLLGQLNDPARQTERETVECYFEDDEAFEDLLETENELMGQYLRGELSPEDHAAFAEYLNRLPDGRERLAFTKTLIEAVRPQAATEAATVHLPSGQPSRPEAERAPVSWWQAVWMMIRQPALAALLILLGAAMTWLLMQPLRTENGQLRAKVEQQTAEQESLQQRLQTLDQQYNNERTRAEQVQSELERLQQQYKAQTQLMAEIEIADSSLMTWSLLPTSERGSPPVYQTVALKKNTRTIAIQAQVEESGRYQGYNATLQTEKGQIVWEQKMKQPVRIVHVLPLRLPARLLTERDYKLTLELIKTSVPTPPASYYFTIVNR